MCVCVNVYCFFLYTRTITYNCKVYNKYIGQTFKLQRSRYIYNINENNHYYTIHYGFILYTIFLLIPKYLQMYVLGVCIILSVLCVHIHNTHVFFFFLLHLNSADPNVPSNFFVEILWKSLGAFVGSFGFALP